MPTEVELKLSASPAAFAAVRRHRALTEANAGRARSTSIVSRYYDTPTNELLERGDRAAAAAPRRAVGCRRSRARATPLRACIGAPNTNGRCRARDSIRPSWPRRPGPSCSPKHRAAGGGLHHRSQAHRARAEIRRRHARHAVVRSGRRPRRPQALAAVRNRNRAGRRRCPTPLRSGAGAMRRHSADARACEQGRSGLRTGDVAAAAADSRRQSRAPA